MRVLIDILHPGDVHFFRNPIRLLQDEGHEVRITSREKDCTIALLDEYGLEHECLTRQNGGSLPGMAKELATRNRRLAAVAREFKPDVMAGLAGLCVAQVGRWLGIRSVIFSDTENAHLQNALTYPFASKVVLPACYKGWTTRRNTIRYRGYHELPYLHPKYFQPDREIAVANGLAPEGDTFIIRTVSWKANHDIGVNGWSTELLDAVVEKLAALGRVIISAEGPLPEHMERHRFSGDAGKIHHVMAHCRAYVGESATMSSEAVVLGVPGVYAATISRGYVDEQDERYGMTRIVGIDSTPKVLEAVDELLKLSREKVRARHRRLLDDTIDVTEFVREVLLEPRIGVDR